MKKTLLLLLSGSFCLSISGQITRENNSVRNGDEIIKQQMQYKDPGRSGENVIWDFSMLKAVNPKYKLTFVLRNLSMTVFISWDEIHYSKKTPI